MKRRFLCTAVATAFVLAAQPPSAFPDEVLAADSARETVRELRQLHNAETPTSADVATPGRLHLVLYEGPEQDVVFHASGSPNLPPGTLDNATVIRMEPANHRRGISVRMHDGTPDAEDLRTAGLVLTEFEDLDAILLTELPVRNDPDWIMNRPVLLEEDRTLRFAETVALLKESYGWDDGSEMMAKANRAAPSLCDCPDDTVIMEYKRNDPPTVRDLTVHLLRVAYDRHIANGRPDFSYQILTFEEAGTWNILAAP